MIAFRARRLPVEFECMEWSGGADNAGDVIDWILCGNSTARYHEQLYLGTDSAELDCEEYIAIDTLEGTMMASPGDIVIKGIKGEFWACKPDVFHETYEVILTHPQ